MKKILIFSLSFYPSHVGGAEVAIKEITDRIDPQHIAFHLLCNRYDSTLPKMEKIGNVTVHRIGLCRKGADTTATSRTFFYAVKILFIPGAVLKALSLHREHCFDGIWAMMVYMTFPIALMRILGVRLPYAVTVQEGEPFERVFERWHIRVFLPLLRYGVCHATVVQAISSFLGEWPRRMGYTGTVELIPNGVDIAHFSQTFSCEALAETRAKMGITDGDTVLAHVGRMVGKNGIDDIIHALVFLPPNVSFVQIGSGPDEKKLKRLAQECGVAGRARFLGFVGHAELPKYLSASGIFVRPSLSEGMGNALIEAMAVGVPVIATQIGGIADFLFDPEQTAGHEPTGRVVPPNDPERIARAVLRTLEEKELTRRIVAHARALVRRKYDWNTIAQKMRARVFSRILQI